jgi:Ca2+-binding EF-hand superfamily protein
VLDQRELDAFDSNKDGKITIGDAGEVEPRTGLRVSKEDIAKLLSLASEPGKPNVTEIDLGNMPLQPNQDTKKGPELRGIRIKD